MKFLVAFIWAFAVVWTDSLVNAAGDEEEQAVQAIRKAGGSVGKGESGPVAGKYHYVFCPWDADSDAVMNQIRHLKQLDKVWFWIDGPATKRRQTPGDKYVETLAAVSGLIDLRIELTTDTAMKHLGEMTKLEKLHLVAKDLTNIGTSQLSKLKELRELRINGIADEDLKHIGSLSKLQKLGLYYNTKIEGSGLKHLSQLKELEFVDLNYTGVDDAGVKALGGLPKLHDLRLVSTNVTDAGCKDLVDFQELKFLYLGVTKISDKGAKLLASMNKLETLDLSATQLGEEGLLAIAGGCKSLRQLVVTQTKTSAKSREEFRKLRPGIKLVADL
jgi:Leucine-rich repeat (LRR) protein